MQRLLPGHLIGLVLGVATADAISVLQACVRTCPVVVRAFRQAGFPRKEWKTLVGARGVAR